MKKRSKPKPFYPENKCIPLPFVVPCEWNNEGHDMMVGPCSCGSWHVMSDWDIKLKPKPTENVGDVIKGP